MRVCSTVAHVTECPSCAQLTSSPHPGTLNFHDILDGHPKADEALRMLYRPGHYDLIYAR